MTHRISPQAKLVAVVAFVVVVVLTPREWVLAFAAYAVMIVVVLAMSAVPARRVLAGLVIELPFVLFALVLPFVGPEPQGWAGLSVPGMWAAWNILVKATLGMMAATVLAATTLPVELVAGLQALRLPQPVVAIFTFFIRYVDVVADQYTRMRTAQAARGLNPRSLRSWPVLAAGMGALFVRSFERGERVHLALVSRGYDGRLPAPPPGEPGSWLRAVALPASAAVIFVLAAALWW